MNRTAKQGGIRVLKDCKSLPRIEPYPFRKFMPMRQQQSIFKKSMGIRAMIAVSKASGIG
jgi:hypothetical protein